MAPRAREQAAGAPTKPEVVPRVVRRGPALRCQSGQWEHALALLKEMREQSEREQTGKTNNNNNARGGGGGGDGGRGGGRAPRPGARSGGVAPDEYSYASAITACARANKLGHAFAVLDEASRDDASHKDLGS